MYVPFKLGLLDRYECQTLSLCLVSLGWISRYQTNRDFQPFLATQGCCSTLEIISDPVPSASHPSQLNLPNRSHLCTFYTCSRQLLRRSTDVCVVCYTALRLLLVSKFHLSTTYINTCSSLQRQQQYLHCIDIDTPSQFRYIIVILVKVHYGITCIMCIPRFES